MLCVYYFRYCSIYILGNRHVFPISILKKEESARLVPLLLLLLWPSWSFKFCPRRRLFERRKWESNLRKYQHPIFFIKSVSGNVSEAVEKRERTGNSPWWWWSSWWVNENGLWTKTPFNQIERKKVEVHSWFGLVLVIIIRPRQRPYRATKAYIAIAVLLFLFSSSYPNILHPALYLLQTSTLAYRFLGRKGRKMSKLGVSNSDEILKLATFQRKRAEQTKET